MVMDKVLLLVLSSVLTVVDVFILILAEGNWSLVRFYTVI